MASDDTPVDPGIITSPAELAGWLTAYFWRNQATDNEGYPVHEPSLHPTEWRVVIDALEAAGKAP